MDESKKIKGETPKQSVKKRSFGRRLLRIFLYFFISLIGLNILLYILLSIPAIQQMAANFAVNQLKSTLKTEVSIAEVRISLFNQVSLKGIYVEDQSKDTLLYAEALDVKLSPWELIKNKKLSITSIDLDDFVINISKKDSISDLNFQFIIDAFSSSDSVQTDSTESMLKIEIKDIAIQKGRLRYNVYSDSTTVGLFNSSHISVYDLYANLDLNSIYGDKLDITLNSLKAKEQSGLDITSLKGRLYSDKSLLWVEGLTLLLPNSELMMDKATYDLSTDKYELVTQKVDVEPRDLVAFLPNLKFLRDKVNIKISLTGVLPSVNIGYLELLYGQDAILEGKASIDNYERYADTNISLLINQLKMTQSALTSFAQLGDSTFVAPDILREMGDIRLKGELKGKLSHFSLDAETWCRQGGVTLSAKGRVDSTFTYFDIISSLKTQNFNLGKLLGEDTGLQQLSAQVVISANQSVTKPLNAKAHGEIGVIGYESDIYKSIPFEAFYDAEKMGISASSDLKIGKIEAMASMTQEVIPEIKVRLRVDDLHVDRFYKNDDWENPRLTFALNGDIKGLDIDKMTGKVSVDSLHLSDEEDIDFRPGSFVLEMGQTDDGKFVQFTSSLLSASIQGQYAFQSLADEFSHIMNSYLPSVFPHSKQHSESENDFTFNMVINNTENLREVFPLPIDIIETAHLKGTVNTLQKNIYADGILPYIRFGSLDIKNTTIDIANKDSAFNIIVGSGVIMDKGDYKVFLKIDGANDVIHATANVKSHETEIKIDGSLDAIAAFSRNEEKALVSSLDVSPSDLLIGRLALNILPANIINSGDRTEIQNLGVGLNGKPYFGVDGIISEHDSDSLKLYFDHAEIGDLLEAFDIKDIRGRVNGNIMLTNLLKQPELYTKKLKMEDIVVFSDTLGMATLDSQWSDYFGGIRLDAILSKGDSYLAELDGTFYTLQDSLDLQLRLQEMPLKWIHPFVSDILNKLDGSISTNLLIEGSTKAPKIRGFLGFNDAQIGIDYTNVVYIISDTIRIAPDRIGFDNLTLKDPKGRKASVNATITHKNFNHMTYALDMEMNNLMVLNTLNRTDSLFYGRVYATGNVKMRGTNDGIKMDMNIKNDKNSVLNILLPQRSEASDYKSVVYINVPEDKMQGSLNNEIRQPFLPIKLNVLLTVTPDIKLGVVIDQQTGDEMVVNGTGVIDFNYDMSNENMSVRGDYSLTNGEVKLNLQNIKKLNFKIQDGSKLHFKGNPLDTEFNITAYRRVKADLLTLDNSFGFDGNSTKTIVDCILGIKGDIEKMDVTYNISLPDANDDVRRSVNTLISTEEQKIRNFASLVATGTFYVDIGGAGASFGKSIWTNIASSALSSGLTALVGNVLGDKWEIGANVDSNTSSSENLDVTVNASTKFFEDKLKVTTNVGYRGDDAVDNAFIGDFDVEYQLSPAWILRGYSHTNDRYYRTAPTTQGIGITYTKEASSLKRLFRLSKFKRRMRGSTPLPTDSVKPITPVKEPVTK